MELDPSVHEWLNLVIRWAHVFAGILWIGSTWLFAHFDKALHEAEKEVKDGSPPRIWLVHGGAFWVVEKHKPSLMGMKLHWFKWEAGMTWITGFLLLIVVYYIGGGVLTDDSISDISHGAAVALGLGVLVVGWLVYDALWISPIGRNFTVGAVISYLLLLAVTYGLTRVFSGRAAYLHIGALLGTCMAANVWMRIIPGQRKVIGAMMEGRTPDLTLTERGKQRSKHNTFMVMPAVFIMISNHFPSATYGRDLNWLMLGVLILVGFVAAKIVRDR
jgi:uncharacterized membrane protein